MPTYFREFLVAGLCSFLLLATASCSETAEWAAKLRAARGAVASREFARAAKLLDEVIAISASEPEPFYLRGRERLRAGQFAAAVEDFDRYIELQPAAGPRLWERGIACYYAGQYAAGAEQFSAYQTFDGNDVENAVWHLLCRTKLDGIAAARRSALRVKQDRRVPMSEIDRMFRGQLSATDVLHAAETCPEPQRNAAQFYAHLYLGIYLDATGEPDDARVHLRQAVDKYPIDHYMWDIARVHLRELEKSQ
ncbi:MAG: tetratricopeptide repeat protein [Planctomycetales bacterium]|nr:tetratricopeptide repeat protein [Planctomycetales bacterium]